jgi:hypothetical protein
VDKSVTGGFQARIPQLGPATRRSVAVRSYRYYELTLVSRRTHVNECKAANSSNEDRLWRLRSPTF